MAKNKPKPNGKTPPPAKRESTEPNPPTPPPPPPIEPQVRTSRREHARQCYDALGGLIDLLKTGVYTDLADGMVKFVYAKAFAFNARHELTVRFRSEETAKAFGLPAGEQFEGVQILPRLLETHTPEDWELTHCADSLTSKLWPLFDRGSAMLTGPQSARHIEGGLAGDLEHIRKQLGSALHIEEIPDKNPVAVFCRAVRALDRELEDRWTSKTGQKIGIRRASPDSLPPPTGLEGRKAVRELAAARSSELRALGDAVLVTLRESADGAVVAELVAKAIEWVCDGVASGLDDADACKEHLKKARRTYHEHLQRLEGMKALVKVAPPDEGNAKREQWFPAAYYQTHYGLTPDQLRKAAERGHIKSRKGPGNRNEYLHSEVEMLWPESVRPAL